VSSSFSSLYHAWPLSFACEPRYLRNSQVGPQVGMQGVCDIKGLNMGRERILDVLRELGRKLSFD